MRNLIVPLLFAAALTASAQRFSFGVKAGAPVTSALPYDFKPYTMVDTGRWTVGPTAEVRLAGPVSFEFDALFRGYRLQEASYGVIPVDPALTSFAPIFVSIRQDAREWDFPLLLKYRFLEGPVRPFLTAGFQFAHASSDFTQSLSCIGTADACNPNLGTYLHSDSVLKSTVNRRGPAAGAGVEFKVGRFRIAPEVRYTKLTHPGTNEVTVLAGFTF